MSGVWVWFPAVGPIRLSTVIGAAIVFTVVSVARRDVLPGGVAVLAWTSLFETIYGTVGLVVYHYPPGQLIWTTAALAGWVILAWRMNIRPEWRLTVVFVVTMAVWIAAGFHSNVAGQAYPINMRDEVLNEVAKSSLGLAYLVGSLISIPAEYRVPWRRPIAIIGRAGQRLDRQAFNERAMRVVALVLVMVIVAGGSSWLVMRPHLAQTATTPRAQGKTAAWPPPTKATTIHVVSPAQPCRCVDTRLWS